MQGLLKIFFFIVSFLFVPNEEETFILKTLLDEQEIRKAEKFVEASVSKLKPKICVLKYSVVAEANHVDSVTILSVNRSHKAVAL